MKDSIKRTTIADRILFLFLIVISISGIFISKEALPQGSDVIIEIDGKPEYTLPLNIDKTISVNGPYGITRIQIKDKKVRIMEAHCPNQLCVKNGWISRGVIVCLPNRILIIVGSGNNPGKDIDAITG
ncbi:MAG: NusG domain II-containing protein [Nitrospirota bacterium]